MVYANAHILVRANGAFPNASGNEKWSAGFRLGIVGADVAYLPGAMQALADACHTAFVAFHSHANVYAGNNTYFTHATVARVGPDGKYLPLGQPTVASEGAPAAGTTTAVHPWTSACVISLRTSNLRGYASNGRVYWPAQSIPVTAGSGRIDASILQQRMDRAAILISALNTAGSAYAANLRVCVMSKVGGGTTAVVTSVRGDDRLDNVENRENVVPPLYKTAVLP